MLARNSAVDLMCAATQKKMPMLTITIPSTRIHTSLVGGILKAASTRLGTSTRPSPKAMM